MSQPLVVLTGPGTPRAAAPWAAAAEAAGWRAEFRPIARTELVAIDAAGVDYLPPAWVALTSGNAVPALVRLWTRRPDLKDVPHAVLGLDLARQLGKHGKTPELVATGDGVGIETLSRALIEASETGDRVFWPRGARTTELREQLVAAGRYVQAPIAYRTVPNEAFEPPPRADAVFFASPDAASAWLRRADVPRATALALGASTYAELAGDYARFVKLVRLAHPRPQELGRALEGLARR